MKSFALTLAVLFGTLGVAFAAPAVEETEELTVVSEEVPANTDNTDNKESAQ